ncbi:MAG: hypothetical protein Q8N99_03445 [Nanoarchaeota archaeon]|nr:hypothetical protein [Nanoarchaeota archaeon]
MEKIPKRTTVNTGDQDLVQETIDDFFTDTLEFILKNIGEDNRRYFEIRVQGLYNPPNTCLDDMIHLLLYKQRVIAVVTETRNDFNYVVYDFFRNLSHMRGYT